MNEETIKERERIKNLIIKGFDETIKWREENIKHPYKRNVAMLEKTKQHLLFLIDNPDYVRKAPLSNEVKP